MSISSCSFQDLLKFPLPFASKVLLFLFMILLKFYDSVFFFSLVYIKIFSNNDYVNVRLVGGKYRNNTTAAARVFRDRYTFQQ
jgi:hypothetical protein